MSDPVQWQCVDDDAVQWDARVAALAGGNFYQSHGWGEVKQRLGWRVLRLTTHEAAVQVLWRPYGLGVVLAWVPGGPAGTLFRSEAGANAGWCVGLPQAIRQQTRARMLYLRVNALQARSGVAGQTDAAPHALGAAGWRVPAARLGSGLSMVYALQRSAAERLAAASRDWRNNLKRSAKHGLRIVRWDAPDVAAAAALFRQLEKIKGIGTQVTEAELAAYAELLGEHLIWMRCDDASGAPIALRLAARFGDTVWEMLATASADARKVSASHAVLWAMLDHCAQQGALHYDLGGIDPEGNQGVFDFKQGLGAPRLEYLGEWEWASNPLLRRAANFAIRRRGGAP